MTALQQKYAWWASRDYEIYINFTYCLFYTAPDVAPIIDMVTVINSTAINFMWEEILWNHHHL